jgi:hypothetical protein
MAKDSKSPRKDKKATGTQPIKDEGGLERGLSAANIDPNRRNV